MENLGIVVICLMFLMIMHLRRKVYTQYMKNEFYRILSSAKIDKGERQYIEIQVSRLDTRLKDLFKAAVWKNK